jgi:hypothetical protein
MIMLHTADRDTVGSPTSVWWKIEAQGWFSRHFSLYQGDAYITTLQMQLWREGCDFTITGHNFTIRKASIWKDAFQLVAGGESVCDVQRNFWSRRFELVSAEQTRGLQPAGWFSTAYQLLAGGIEVGRISRADWWSRRRVANFAPTVPPPIQVLAIFLVLILAQRRNKSN